MQMHYQDTKKGPLKVTPSIELQGLGPQKSMILGPTCGYLKNPIKYGAPTLFLYSRSTGKEGDSCAAYQHALLAFV